MTLREWLDAQGKSVADAARAFDAHPMTVYKWRAGIAMPRPEALARIAKVTGGAVTANDFLAARTAEAA